MAVVIPLKAIALSPGSHLAINDVTWEQYEALLEELGEEHRCLCSYKGSRIMGLWGWQARYQFAAK